MTPFCFGLRLTVMINSSLKVLIHRILTFEPGKIGMKIINSPEFSPGFKISNIQKLNKQLELTDPNI